MSAEICSTIPEPVRQHTPWSGKLSADLRKGALSVCAAGMTLIDAKGVCWGVVFPDKSGSYDHVPLIVEAVNSHATLKARIQELESNALEQAKLLADTGRRVEEMADILRQSREAMLTTRTASIAGCEEGYGKPGKWADELFCSHGGLTAAIKAIDAALSSGEAGK